MSPSVLTVGPWPSYHLATHPPTCLADLQVGELATSSEQLRTRIDSRIRHVDAEIRAQKANHARLQVSRDTRPSTSVLISHDLPFMDP